MFCYFMLLAPCVMVHSIMSIVPLQDPGISNNQSRGQYPPYDIGLSMGVFITDSSGQPIIGQVVENIM